ncbi:MAG: leucine-rich repeat domain-containing protein [Bacilli bacterium]|nr:leucine-rich repeat domain-containing protein [Bacilli bacterium]
MKKHFLLLVTLLLLVSCGGKQTSNSSSSSNTNESQENSSSPLKEKIKIEIVNENIDMGEVSSSKTVLKDEEVIIEAKPFAGFDFVGWFKNDQLFSNELTLNFKASENLTLTAKFDYQQLTIEYYVNNQKIKEEQFKANKHFELQPLDVPNFVGWYEDINLTRKAVYTGDLVKQGKIVKVYGASYVGSKGFGLRYDENGYRLIKYRGQEKEINVPGMIDKDKVYKIDDYLFNDFLGVEKITFNEGTEILGKNILFNQTNLVDVTLPTTIKEIGEYAFYNNLVLDNVKLPLNLEKLGAYSFAQTNIKEIELGDKIEVIQEGTFSVCLNLKKVILGKNIKEIKDEAFYNDFGINEVFFKGSEEEFSQIKIGVDNEAFIKAPKYFYSEVYKEGNYFYLKDGQIVKWAEEKE